MQQYVDQLLETLVEARNNHPGPRHIEVPPEEEENADIYRDFMDMILP